MPSGITSSISDLLSNPYLRVCFWVGGATLKPWASKIQFPALFLPPWGHSHLSPQWYKLQEGRDSAIHAVSRVLKNLLGTWRMLKKIFVDSMNNECCYTDHKREESERLPWNDVGVKKQQRLPHFCVLEVLFISWRFHFWPLSPPDQRKEEGGGNPSCGLWQAALARSGRVPVRLASEKRLWVTSSDSEAAESEAISTAGDCSQEEASSDLSVFCAGEFLWCWRRAEKLKQSLSSHWAPVYTNSQQ